MRLSLLLLVLTQLSLGSYGQEHGRGTDGGRGGSGGSQRSGTEEEGSACGWPDPLPGYLPEEPLPQALLHLNGI